MVTEAVGAAKPVYVADHRSCERRYARFHAAMLEHGRTRAWPDDGTLELPSAWAVDERPRCEGAERAAERIWELLAQRGVGKPADAEGGLGVADGYREACTRRAPTG
jgi:mitochondrial fission protein ELM1